MRRRFGILAIVFLVAATMLLPAQGTSEEAPVVSAAVETAELAAPEELTDRFSYAFGYLFTQSYMQDGISFNADYFSEGMKAALAEEDGLYTQEEINTILMEYQTVLMEEEQAAQAAAGTENLEEAEAFLAANTDREGVITTESGLQYEVIVEGDGAKPTADDVVTVHYKGSFLNGTVFESSYDSGSPATFALGGVISGWVEGLQLMPVGSKYRLYLHPDLAYGEMGSSPVIGPSQMLIFEVELLSIEAAE